MTDTTGLPLEAEEKSYIQHHQASSYVVKVVAQSSGSTVPCCSRRSDTKLDVVHGEARRDRCTGSCQKVVVDEWESWNLQMMRWIDWYGKMMGLT